MKQFPKFNSNIICCNPLWVLLRVACLPVIVVVMLLVGIHAPAAHSANNKIILYLDDNNAFHNIIKNSLVESLKNDYEIVTTWSLDKSTTTKDDLIVSIGTQHAMRVLSKQERPPLLALLIPESRLEQLTGIKKENNVALSVVLIDQPITRQLELINHLSKRTLTTGVLLGPDSGKIYKNRLRLLASKRTKLVTLDVTSGDNLSEFIDRVLSMSDILLTIPDPLIYNRNTIKSSLLATYRKRKPVIGFSRSYVNAGAMAAVYSTPQQIARQGAEMISGYFKQNNNKFNLLINYPKYFSVATNTQVARSLGFRLPERKTLEQLIRNAEAGQ